VVVIARQHHPLIARPPSTVSATLKRQAQTVEEGFGEHGKILG